MERRFEKMPDAMALGRCTVEHVVGTIKGRMGTTHFRTRRLKNVATEDSFGDSGLQYEALSQSPALPRPSKRQPDERS